MIQSTVITDANVLIDYNSVGLLDILSLYSTEVSQIKIPDVILEEVDGLTHKLALMYKFEVVEIELSILKKAVEMKGGTSPQDNTCFLLAQETSSACLTSDRCLYNLCKDNGVKVIRNLYPIISLYEMKVISYDEALESAKKICKENPYLGSVVYESFQNKLSTVEHKK